MGSREGSTMSMMDTIGERRRHWSWPEPLKWEIVAAAAAPGASVSIVARQYDVNTNLVFTWRRRFAAEANAVSVPQLMPVVVTTDQPAAAPPPAPASDTIEIELPRGTRKVGAGVRPAVLRPVLDALERW